MDDIVITGNDEEGISKLKAYLFKSFQTKDLEKLKYFLGIEVAQSYNGVVISQKMYALDIFEEIGMLYCKPIDKTHNADHWDVAIRVLRYIKKAPSQGLIYEDKGHTQIIGYSDADWASSPFDRRSTSGYCILIGDNLISWKNKKQDVVTRSSAEAEYRAMALTTCELI
ncbi:PREDICTED: uncharacterized protein LOC109176567 [Ipomoea nil]|uniref:uncharacterized protein LOC109176567 n=1 Tax=Ipomoea nil TaxID=35883 RepID=UPI0009008722|nr:PREDICTED: uncharacterized protein LOC109176567 [Ipomoea nil]